MTPKHAFDILVAGEINPDLILVLDKGAIVASGKHAELLDESPIYAEIYNSQLIEDSVSRAPVSSVE